MQVLSLLPLSLSSLVATQHFSSFLLHRICQAIYPTHTLSDISHILYSPLPPSMMYLHSHNIWCCGLSHSIFLISVGVSMSPASAWCVMALHGCNIVLCVAALGVRLARFCGRNISNMSDTFNSRQLRLHRQDYFNATVYTDAR